MMERGCARDSLDSYRCGSALGVRIPRPPPINSERRATLRQSRRGRLQSGRGTTLETRCASSPCGCTRPGKPPCSARQAVLSSVRFHFGRSLEEAMNRLIIRLLTTVGAALLCSGIVLPGAVGAQTSKAHVGTWALISSDTVRPDGSRVPTFGGKATGVLIFGGDGRFIYLFSRAELPKFASNNRTTGTPDENAAVVKGSISTYGTYSVDGKTFKIKVENSTFPNWTGAEQTRTITVAGDEMKWSNPAGSGGGVVELVLKRVK